MCCDVVVSGLLVRVLVVMFWCFGCFAVSMLCLILVGLLNIYFCLWVVFCVGVAFVGCVGVAYFVVLYVGGFRRVVVWAVVVCL